MAKIFSGTGYNAWNASRAYEAIQQIKLTFFNAMPADIRTSIYADGAMYSGSMDEG